MGLIRCVAVMLTFAVLAHAGLEAADDLSAVCQRLEDTRYKAQVGIEKDGESFYNFANVQLTELAKFGNLAEVGQLRAAWNRALHRKGCYAEALNDVAIIASCQPERFESMSSLTQATRSLANECLGAKYITNKVESATKSIGCFLPSCLKGYQSSDFIDHWFIQTYRKSNPEDAWMDLSAVTSEKTYHTIYMSIVFEFWQKKLSAWDQALSYDHEAMAEYLIKHLYKPCKRLIESAGGVMGKIFDASRYYNRGLERLFADLDESIQEAAFRYNLCKIFVDEQRPEKVAREVVKEFLMNK